MKRILTLTFVILILYCKKVNAQQEFFGNTSGLTVSGSTNLDGLYSGGIDVYLKHNVIVSGMIADYRGYDLLGASINFLISGKDYDNPTKGIFGISYATLPYNRDVVIAINAGIVQVICQNSNFPFSLSAIANMNIYNLKVIPIISYTQTFFAQAGLPYSWI